MKPVDKRDKEAYRASKTPDNPSVSATARVTNPLPIPTACRYCAGPVKCVNNATVYGRPFGDWPYMYLCSDCGAYVGLHPFTALPLGTLADADLRHARKINKGAFERIWQDGYMSRTEAYAWLAQQLGITQAECHFGLFEADRCRKAFEVCVLYLQESKHGKN